MKIFKSLLVALALLGDSSLASGQTAPAVSQCPEGQRITTIKKVKSFGRELSTPDVIFSGCTDSEGYKSKVYFAAARIATWAAIEKGGVSYFMNAGQCAGRQASWGRGETKGGGVTKYTADGCGGQAFAQVTEIDPGSKYKVTTWNSYQTSPDEVEVVVEK